MKINFINISFLALYIFIFSVNSFGQDTIKVKEQEIISWIQQNAIPIKHVEAGNDFSDLQPLKKLLKDVKVVGLGEATHGSKEIFQIKHRLLEFLVVEMGYNAFAFEASYAACQLINEYILNGKADLATVLTGQGYTAWDTEEFSEMLKWLQHHNMRLPEAKKVRFYGLDLWVNEVGRKRVLNYLKKIAPDRITTTDPIFRVLAREEAKWPMAIDAESEKSLLHILPNLQDLIDYMTENKDKFVSSTSLAEFNQAVQHVKVMKRWIMANTTALLPPSVDKSYMRSVYMAENLLDLIDQEGEDKKFVAWLHNGQIAKGGLFQKEAYNFGSQLRRSLEDTYYAFSIEFNQGSFQFRSYVAGNSFGDLQEGTANPAPVGSFAWYLSSTNLGNLILDLRTHVGNPVLIEWLKDPLKAYSVGWAYPDGTHDHLIDVEFNKRYDGIIFIDKTTPTRPTANALKTVANKEGF